MHVLRRTRYVRKHHNPIHSQIIRFIDCRLSIVAQICSARQVERVLAGADAWQFDTWRLRDITGGFPLSALGFFLIHRAGLTQRFNIKPGTLARCA